MINLDNMQRQNYKPMNNMQKNTNSHKLQSYESGSYPSFKAENPSWQFQKVQSVYRVAKQQIQNLNDDFDLTSKIKPQSTNLNQFIGQQKPLDYYQNQPYSHQNFNNKPKWQKETYKNSRNLSSKANSETNVISQSRSLEYLSSQEPSFSSKGQFTVLEEFNTQNHNSKTQNPFSQHANLKQDWKIASFAPRNITQMGLKQNCIKILEFLQQLKFLKEGFETKLKQQKNHFTTELQQVKKLLFKLNIKHEKQILEITKNNSQQSGFKSSRVSISSTGNSQELKELRIYCQKLQEQKAKAEQKYSNTLRKYQQQIEIISLELQNKIHSQAQMKASNNQSQQIQCQNCINLQQMLQNYTAVNQQIQFWKNLCQKEEQKHALIVKKLQDKVSMLQQELHYVQKNKNQIQKLLKEKQKQLLHSQSEFQYRLRDIQKRQRQIQIAQKMILNQREQIERKKEKFSDYEFKVLREQRKQKNQFKQRQILSSEYFSNSQRTKNPSQRNIQYERSDSVSSKGSRIDINARLREIQMMKGKGSRNYDESITSRNSSKDKIHTGFKQFSSSRVSSSSRNLKDYGISVGPATQRGHSKESSQTIKLSEKLNKLTQKLQNQLREIN